jgi:hypothetical protein
MKEAATGSASAETSTTTTDNGDAAAAVAKPPTPVEARKALREKLVPKIKAALQADEDGPAKPNGDAAERRAAERDGKGKAKEKGGDDGKKAAAKKPEAKDGKAAEAKGKDGAAGKEKPKDGEEPEVEGDQKALVKGWRDLRHAKRKFEDTQRVATERIKRAEELERRQAEQAEAFEKDPLAWLRARGKNVREVLLRVAREDGEDPKDKAIREAKEKADTALQKLTEREKRDQDAEIERKAQVANQKIESTMLEEYEQVDPDDYPTLARDYEPAQVATFARQLLLKYYKATGKELAPRALFRRLETVLSAQEERREARRKRAGKTDGANAPRSPDRGRAAARGDAENLEDDAESNPRRPADVTSRETRLSTRPGGREDRAALRRRLVSMAAERIVD